MSAAWYDSDSESFIQTNPNRVVADLSSSAIHDGWHIEEAQHEEWAKSVQLLQEDIPQPIDEGVKVLRDTLRSRELSDFSDVILEYNMRRRGLRIDALLFAPGLIAVLEFKRGQIAPAHFDQVVNYCVNLLEFHDETRCAVEAGTKLLPIVVRTDGRDKRARPTAEFKHFPAPWQSIFRPHAADHQSLERLLRHALGNVGSDHKIPRSRWLTAPFAPSASIVDAAISLWGQHDVSAIRQHKAPVEKINAMVQEVTQSILEAQGNNKNRIIMLSGAPGAGKTLVGLQLAFSEQLRTDSVFVTGNAPLVEVLQAALKRSYSSGSKKIPAGYPMEAAKYVYDASTFKIVKAHNFLGERDKDTQSSDGRVVIFDEAQRTYEQGRRVLNKPLSDHEANLILAALERSYGDGAVVVALIGNNQAINRGERGAVAWFEAAESLGWEVAIADETFNIGEFKAFEDKWSSHNLRRPLTHGHLEQSLRFYHDARFEQWAHAVLVNSPNDAKEIARSLAEQGKPIHLTRNLEIAKTMVRNRRVGDERIGLIATGNARRLAAEGLFVELKPSIANWMLEPTGDVRSSNMLETVQNEYQIQGLELDHTVVCWDADLRRISGQWEAFKMWGSDWRSDSATEIARNSYRVLLTRARSSMTLFVPVGDDSGIDQTRKPAFYQDIADFLIKCGAEFIDAASS